MLNLTELAAFKPAILLFHRPWVPSWPKPETTPRRPRTMSFMRRTLKPAAINTRLFDRSGKAIRSSALMNLKQCESCYFAYMFFIKLEPPAEKCRPFWKEHTPPCQSIYTSLWLKLISWKPFNNKAACPLWLSGRGGGHISMISYHVFFFFILCPLEE